MNIKNRKIDNKQLNDIITFNNVTTLNFPQWSWLPKTRFKDLNKVIRVSL